MPAFKDTSKDGMFEARSRGLQSRLRRSWVKLRVRARAAECGVALPRQAQAGKTAPGQVARLQSALEPAAGSDMPADRDDGLTFVTVGKIAGGYGRTTFALAMTCLMIGVVAECRLRGWSRAGVQIRIRRGCLRRQFGSVGRVTTESRFKNPRRPAGTPQPTAPPRSRKQAGRARL